MFIGEKQSNTEEGDAGEAATSDLVEWVSVTGKPLSEEEWRELIDGPPPGWRAGTVALDAAGAKAEEIGLESGYERLAAGDGPDSHIIRGQD